MARSSVAARKCTAARTERANPHRPRSTPMPSLELRRSRAHLCRQRGVLDSRARARRRGLREQAMVGKGLAKRLGTVRGRVGRVGLTADRAARRGSVIAVSCETAPPSRDSAPPSFAALPPLVFDLGRIEVVERPAAPHPDDVAHLFPTPPAVAIALWVTERLRASGTVGALRVTVDEASARSTRLEDQRRSRRPVHQRAGGTAGPAAPRHHRGDRCERRRKRQRLSRRQALPHIAGGHHPRRARTHLRRDRACPSLRLQRQPGAGDPAVSQPLSALRRFAASLIFEYVPLFWRQSWA